MGIAAFLCGLFYGAFGLWVWQRQSLRRRLDRRFAEGMKRLLSDITGEDCEWPWGREELYDGAPLNYYGYVGGKFYPRPVDHVTGTTDEC
jgi:hypothetical protein